MKIKRLNEIHEENWEDDINWDEEEQTSDDMIKRILIKKYKQIPKFTRYMKRSDKDINTFMNQDISDKKFYDVYQVTDEGRYSKHLGYVKAGTQLMARIIVAIRKNNPEIFCIRGFYNARLINKEEVLNKLKRESDLIQKKIDQIENPKGY